MADQPVALTELWDRFVDLAHRLEGADWSLRTGELGVDVRGMVAHVAFAGLDREPVDLLTALRDARARQLAELAGDTSERVLGARCLDLYVHTHDLAVALGEPTDLHDDSPAAAAACRYLRRLTPHLVAREQVAADGVALGVQLFGTTEAVAVAAGRGAWVPAAGDLEASVAATPAAYVLLLAGRVDPSRCRAEGALEWAGAAGAAFIERMRLFPAG